MGSEDKEIESGKKTSNVGKWDAWYGGVDPASPHACQYGDTVTYLMAASFMMDVGEVEDWGCGAGGFKRFYRGRYIGLDGSKTPIAEKIVDLCEYKSSVDGIVIRHVLEHNYDWAKILDNALGSFRKKLCLILFTPFAEETKEIAHNAIHGIDAPDLSFSQADIDSRMQAAGVRFELYGGVPTPTGYECEHVYFVWRL
jgi:hypothetical protein